MGLDLTPTRLSGMPLPSTGSIGIPIVDAKAINCCVSPTLCREVITAASQSHRFSEDRKDRLTPTANSYDSDRSSSTVSRLLRVQQARKVEPQLCEREEAERISTKCSPLGLLLALTHSQDADSLCLGTKMIGGIHGRSLNRVSLLEATLDEERTMRRRAPSVERPGHLFCGPEMRRKGIMNSAIPSVLFDRAVPLISPACSPSPMKALPASRSPPQRFRSARAGDGLSRSPRKLDPPARRNTRQAR